MYQQQKDPRWLENMPGLSPLDFVKNLNPKAAITFIVGDNDTTTPPTLTEEFVKAAKRNGMNTNMEIWKWHDHMSVTYGVGFRRMLTLLD